MQYVGALNIICRLYTNMLSHLLKFDMFKMTKTGENYILFFVFGTFTLFLIA